MTPDRHKITVKAGLSGRFTRVFLDDVELMDLKSFDFHVDANDLTVATITTYADVNLNGTLLSEFFQVHQIPVKKVSLLRRLSRKIRS